MSRDPTETKRDPTETKRRELVALINNSPQPREVIEEHYGKVWDTAQLGKDFVVQGFQAPFVVVTRKSDHQEGSLIFQHSPRFYFGFEPYHKDEAVGGDL